MDNFCCWNRSQPSLKQRKTVVYEFVFVIVMGMCFRLFEGMSVLTGEAVQLL